MHSLQISFALHGLNVRDAQLSVIRESQFHIMA